MGRREAERDEVGEELGRAGEEAEPVRLGMEGELIVGELVWVVRVLHPRVEVFPEAALKPQQ